MPIPNLTDVPVLVTGGAGFIGSHLVDALLERGAHVTILDDLSTGSLAHLSRWIPETLLESRGSFELRTRNSEHVAFIEGDIRDLETCRTACKGARFVFHQAAYISVPGSMENPALAMDVNLHGTANIYTAARDAGAKRVIYASSSGVYGDAEALPLKEGSEGQPLSPYGLSKMMCETLAETFGRLYGLQTIGLRYFNVYGPRQDPDGAYAGVIPLFFKAYLTGQAPVIFGDGQQSRDFTYITDAVQANLLAAGAPDEACSRAFNIASGERVTILELARLIRDACGGGMQPVHEPSRTGDVLHSHADSSAAREALGIDVHAGLVAGIPQVAPYYQAVVRNRHK
jgi:UDP-N-acetylglucosamine/UDP-N-acetylgalactosamine 4-epimerase